MKRRNFSIKSARLQFIRLKKQINEEINTVSNSMLTYLTVATFVASRTLTLVIVDSIQTNAVDARIVRTVIDI